MRLDHPAFAAVPAVTITVDGQLKSALPGESVAAALTAVGRLEFRRARSGAPRGLFCGMGACFDCLVTIDGKANQRACLAKVESGMQVRTTAPDELAALVSPPIGTAPEERVVDLLVVGAGPAGLAAALAARRRGAAVTILDERPLPGGQFFKPLAPSHRALDLPDRQFRAGQTLVQAVRQAGVTLENETTVWAAFAPDHVAAIVQGGAVTYRPRQLVLATGAYERPVPIPGWTLPGVMTTGAAQTLARAYRVAPGRRVLIAGNGPLNLQVAVELVEGGATVVAVVESAAEPRMGAAAIAAAAAAPDLMLDGWRLIRRLAQAGVPVLWGSALSAIEGDGRASVAVVRDQRFAVDAVCLGHGFLPSTELTRMLGCAHGLGERHLCYPIPMVDTDGATTIPGVFAVGDGVDLGGARVAQAQGTLAGIATARNLGFGDLDPGEAIRARRARDRAARFQRALWRMFQAPAPDLRALPAETVLCRCEEITVGTLRAHISEGRDTLAALKRHTRLGMGRCQGRYCAATAGKLVAELTARPSAVDSFFAPRLPAKPVPALALIFEQPEWSGHRPAITPNLARPVEHEPVPEQRCAILVIGGGVLGCCTAYFLAADGQDVLVVDRDDINLQASGANAGSLHVQLLSFDFGDKATAGGGPAAATLPLGRQSVALWRDIERDCGGDFEIKTTGGLMLAETARDIAFLKGKIASKRAHGIEAELIGANELRQIAPALSTTLLGAELCPLEGKINPLRATYAVLDRARSRGARFQRGTDVLSIAREGTGFRVETSRGTIRSGRVVNAAGAWASEIGKMVGLAVPVRGAPLQMLVTEPAAPMLDQLVAHADRHLSLKQAASGTFLIGGGWTAAFDPRMRFSSLEPKSIEGNLWVAHRVLPAIGGLNVIRAWAAMNVDIDRAPILGEAPGVPGLFHAVTSNGYTLAPVVAQITAELIRTGRSDRAIAPYLLDRFG